MGTRNTSNTSLNKNKIFVFLLISVIVAFVFINFFYADILYKPSACLCANSFNTDSAVSLRSAKQIVGNGHYEFTIQTAKRDCIKAYESDILKWEKTNKENLIAEQDQGQFFRVLCNGLH